MFRLYFYLNSYKVSFIYKCINYKTQRIRARIVDISGFIICDTFSKSIRNYIQTIEMYKNFFVKRLSIEDRNCFCKFNNLECHFIVFTCLNALLISTHAVKVANDVRYCWNSFRSLDYMIIITTIIFLS